MEDPDLHPRGHHIRRRWIGTLRRELLDRTIIWNRHQLGRLAVDYIEHYNVHRLVGAGNSVVGVDLR